MENREIARMFWETADLMEIAGEDGFRIRSYRNAASVIEGYPEPVAAILKDPEKKVTDIPGIGKGIASGALEEIEKRGSFERRDQMLEVYPPTALELLKIQGLGPKGIRTLFEHYRVSTIDGLEKICQEQKLRELPRMGAKLEEKVLRSIAAYRQRAGRFLLSFAYGVADELVAFLKAIPGVETVTPAGSLRRGKETVGDLDLLATGPNAEAALEPFTKHPKVHEVLARGANKASVKFGLEGLQVDLRTLPKESYGAALQYFTGSKEHSIPLRARAQKMGMTLSEYSLSRVDTKEIVARETEEQIYEALGLRWIPPELRENQGEIEAAEAGKLPQLVELGDIRGDLHMHTLETDGRATLEEMAEAARAQGYEYIAITDHSKALAMANGLDEKRAVAFAHQVREMDQSGLGIRVFSGIECDIRRDGTMDLENDALGELDFVIGSVHSYMNLEAADDGPAAAGARMPTLARPGASYGPYSSESRSLPVRFRGGGGSGGAAQRLSRNQRQSRAPGPDGVAGAAAKAGGAKFVISTDAHHPKHLANMRYGVLMARRGWLEAGDILNTLPVKQFAQVITSPHKSK